MVTPPPEQPDPQTTRGDASPENPSRPKEHARGAAKADASHPEPAKNSSSPSARPPRSAAGTNRPRTTRRQAANAAGGTAESAAPASRRRRLPLIPERHHESITTFLIPYSISIAIHALVLLFLAFKLLPAEMQEELLYIVSTPVEEKQEVEEDPIETLEQPEQIDESALAETEAEVSADQLVDVPADLSVDINDLEPAIDVDLPNIEGPSVNLPKGEFGGRSVAGRKELALKEGGSEASERAVILGLKWLKTVQQPDGSWRFDKVGKADGAGELSSPMGATSMALLAYLGAGHTSFVDGPYQETVTNGLVYLLKNAQLTPDGADLRGTVERHEGMYVQGLAAIALAEAYGMASASYAAKESEGRRKPGSRKAEFQAMKQLKTPAQSAINFIVRAQHQAGGWRYKPGQAGDTSVVGWQVMALQSGRASELFVPGTAMRGASHFLDTVAVNGGAQYGYTEPQPDRPGTTAVGLLCRMYLGWQKSNEALARGVKYLSGVGPRRDNMYYNYYATQVMHHWGGEEWKKWNAVMREMLIKSQVQEGPAAGSWNPQGAHVNVGGRIYQTALSVMTLEVYYRHLPLYRKVTTEAEEF